MKRYVLMSIAVLLIFTGVSATAQEDMTYTIRADGLRVIHNVMGEVQEDVMSVAAQPVQSFAWNGEGVMDAEGIAVVEVDPVANTGSIQVTWTDQYGEWVLTQTRFASPPHPTGLRVSADANETERIQGDPVTTNVFLHGNSGAAEPVLPTIFNILATWGPARVTLNGEPFNNPYDGPAPLWLAHTMTTVGVRNENGEVVTEEGNIYNPSVAGRGATFYDDLEFHLVFHDAPGPETDNFPPALSFNYHLNFEEVSITITQGTVVDR